MDEFNNSLKTELRLDWSELDLFGHINNVSFFKYIQSARVNCFDNIGLTSMHREIGIGPILARTLCDFIRPLFFPGNITVISWIETIKTSSFIIRHNIMNDKQEISAKAEDVIVVYDFNKNEKLPIPASIRSKIDLLAKN